MSNKGMSLNDYYSIILNKSKKNRITEAIKNKQIKKVNGRFKVIDSEYDELNDFTISMSTFIQSNYTKKELYELCE